MTTEAITKTDSKPDTLQDRPAQLLAAEVSLDQKLGEIQRELDAAVSAEAEDILRAELGETVEGAPARGDLQRSLDATLRAIDVARQERQAAITAVKLERARRKGSEASAKRRELATLWERMQPHLDALRELTGTEWAPSQVGVHMGLELECKQLEREATRLAELARVQGSDGVLRGNSIDALVAQATADPMRIAPPLAAIREWVYQASAGARGGQAFGSGDIVLEFELVYRGSVIALDRSSCIARRVS